MPRQLGMAALAIAVVLAFSGFSLAQYHDDDDDGGYYQSNQRQARQYGYQQGYRDGFAPPVCHCGSPMSPQRPLSCVAKRHRRQGCAVDHRFGGGQ